MQDGYGNINLDCSSREYIQNIKSSNGLNVYDIGEESLQNLFDLIDKNDIIFWNGSLGVIENPLYIQGSKKLIDYLVKQVNKKIIIGGGDTSTLIDKCSEIYVSTGGGALLEFLENVSKNNGYLLGINLFM